MTPHLNGSRGETLLWFGLIYIALGVTYIVAPGEVVTQAMGWMPEWSPIWACGVAWVCSGVVGVGFAFTPMPLDRFGFMALAVWSSAWAFAWAISQVLRYSSRGFVSALIFLLLARIVMIVAGMLNPPRAKR